MRGLHSSGCALLVLHREGVAEEAKVAKVVVESVISDGLHVFEREDTNLARSVSSFNAGRDQSGM